jgi:hypothetical protein
VPVIAQSVSRVIQPKRLLTEFFCSTNPIEPSHKRPKPTVTLKRPASVLMQSALSWSIPSRPGKRVCTPSNAVVPQAVVAWLQPPPPWLPPSLAPAAALCAGAGSLSTTHYPILPPSYEDSDRRLSEPRFDALESSISSAGVCPGAAVLIGTPIKPVSE